VITQDILSPAIPLAQVLADDGRQLVAKQNTIMSKLLDSLSEYVVINGTANASVTIEPAFGATNLPRPTYDRVLADASVALAPKVKAHIAHAKGTVKPMVIDYLEFIKARKASYSAPNAESSVTVTVVDIPEIFNDSSFSSNFNLYEGKETNAVDNFDIKFGLPRKSSEEIMALLISGDVHVDDAVKEMVLSKGDSFLIDIWDQFFCSEPARTNNRLSYTNIFETISCMLVVYLLTVNLNQEPEKAGTSQPLLSFKRNMDTRREAAGSIIHHTLKVISSYTASGVLVISNDSIKSTCVLYKPSFDKLLAQGGSMEVVLGAATSGYKATLLADVLRDKEELANRWKTYCMFHNASVSNNTINVFKNILESGFYDMIDKNYGETLAKEPAFADFKTNAIAILKESINKATLADMEDPRKIALTIIAKGMFYYTDAYDILNRGEEVMEANPDMDVREAMLISSIEYMARYLADQMTIV
jgi:hypothetical protein